MMIFFLTLRSNAPKGYFHLEIYFHSYIQIKLDITAALYLNTLIVGFELQILWFNSRNECGVNIVYLYWAHIGFERRFNIVYRHWTHIGPYWFHMEKC